MPREYPTGECVSCHETKTLAARGLCRACYSRWRENGTTEYQRDFRDRLCSVEGCGRRAHGQGLCTLHLQRLRRTGTTEPGRKYEIKRGLDDMRSLDDLYPIWAEFNRAKNPRPVHAAWRDSFEVFKAAIGARPSKMHRLFPIDRTRLLGPDNWEWRERLVIRQEGESTDDYNARHRLARRELNGTGTWDSEYRRKYGADFGLPQVRAMREAQKDLCAIRGVAETAVRNGAVRAMSVDHDHRTGAVRQLLTSAANTLLGAADDDPMLLAKAILYLGKHAEDAETGQYLVNRAIAYLQRHPVASLVKEAILPQD